MKTWNDYLEQSKQQIFSTLPVSVMKKGILNAKIQCEAYTNFFNDFRQEYSHLNQDTFMNIYNEAMFDVLWHQDCKDIETYDRAYETFKRIYAKYFLTK